MGFKQGDLPPVDPATFESIPTLERMKLLCQHWIDYGFGAPKIMHTLYLVKGLFFFIGGWLVIGLTTPDLPLLDIGVWWGELIVLQKAMLWVVLWSATGFNESWGPLAFKFAPMTAGYRYWMRPDTLGLPAVRAVGSFMPRHPPGAAYSGVGLLPAWPCITCRAVRLILRLRDKVTFLASRPEQYSVALLAFGVLTSYAGGVVDMVVVTKIAM